MGKLKDQWLYATTGRMTPEQKRQAAFFQLAGEILFSGVCSEILSEDEEADLNETASMLLWQHFDTIHEALDAFIQHKGQLAQVGKWQDYLTAVTKAAEFHWNGQGLTTWNKPPGFAPFVGVDDRGGSGIAALIQVWCQDAADCDWGLVKWGQNPLLDERDPVGEANTRNIIEQALQGHFPDGPMTAGECRVAYLKLANKGLEPNCIKSYRWDCFENDVQERLATARYAGLAAEEFHSCDLSFAAYRPEPQRPAPITTADKPKNQRNGG